MVAMRARSGAKSVVTHDMPFRLKGRPLGYAYKRGMPLGVVALDLPEVQTAHFGEQS